jgi:hypothetical protein
MIGEEQEVINGPAQVEGDKPLTVFELVERLSKLPPEAPIFGYLGSDGFWFQAEPRDLESVPVVLCSVMTTVTAGGRAR